MSDRIRGGNPVSSVNGETGNVTLSGSEIDSAVSPSNYSAAAADIDSHLTGIDTELGLQDARVTDWTSFTPTGSWTSNTTYTGQFRYVGDTLEVNGQVTLSGAPNNAELDINIPNSKILDGTKWLCTAGFKPCGSAFIKDADGSSYWAYCSAGAAESTTVVRIRIINTASTYGVVTAMSNTVPITFASGDLIAYEFAIPVTTA